MNCRGIQNRLVAYAEAELDERTLLKIEAHLSACDTCREALVQLEATRPGPPTPPNHPPEFWAPMHEAILKELERPPVQSSPLRRRSWTLAYATLMAAAVLWTLYSIDAPKSDATPLRSAPSTSAILIP